MVIYTLLEHVRFYSNILQLYHLKNHFSLRILLSNVRKQEESKSKLRQKLKSHTHLRSGSSSFVFKEFVHSQFHCFDNAAAAVGRERERKSARVHERE